MLFRDTRSMFIIGINARTINVRPESNATIKPVIRITTATAISQVCTKRVGNKRSNTTARRDSTTSACACRRN